MSCQVAISKLSLFCELEQVWERLKGCRSECPLLDNLLLTMIV